MFEDGEVLISEGECETRPRLILVSKGKVGISHNGKHVAALMGPFYVGEGRIIYGEPASATVSAIGPVTAFVLSEDDFTVLASSPNMKSLIPMMRREIQIRAFERVTKTEGRSLWKQLRGDESFLKHLRTHAVVQQLDAHISLYEQVSFLRSRYRGALLGEGNTAQEELTYQLGTHTHTLPRKPRGLFSFSPSVFVGVVVGVVV